jgi:hypothetical protein
VRRARFEIGAYSNRSSHNHDVCFCGESYFQGADGIARVVTSAERALTIWKLQTTPKVDLIRDGNKSASVEQVAPDGFFTSVSSDGIKPGSAVVWAVSGRHDNENSDVNLYAFDPDSGETLYSGQVGDWHIKGGKANLVPTIANGRVFVASDRQLNIFGLGGGVLPKSVIANVAVSTLNAGGTHFFGTVVSDDGVSLRIKTRSNRVVAVDTSDAAAIVDADPGRAVSVRGTMDASGIVHATNILRAQLWPETWEPDQIQ